MSDDRGNLGFVPSNKNKRGALLSALRYALRHPVFWLRDRPCLITCICPASWLKCAARRLRLSLLPTSFSLCAALSGELYLRLEFRVSAMPRLGSWSFVCICFCLLLTGEARGGVLDVQDDNPALVYSGQWFPDASPNAHGKHETWTNASGASVYYDFQGAYRLYYR